MAIPFYLFYKELESIHVEYLLCSEIMDLLVPSHLTLKFACDIDSCYQANGE